MRASRVITISAAGLAVAIGAVVWITRGGTEAVSELPAKTVKVGAIDVRIAPHHVDSSGALLEVTLDTHTTDLKMPLAASLRVGGATWPGGIWSGDPPSGHHRAGEFRFQALGNAAGVVAFTLTGFDEPVSASWDLGDRG